MIHHDCSKEADIEVIKNNVYHIMGQLNSMDVKMDKLGTKRELNIHRGLLIVLWGAILGLFSTIFSIVKG